MKPFELECEVTETTAQRDLFLTVRRVVAGRLRSAAGRVMDSLTQVSAVLLPVAQPTYRVKTSGSGTQTTRYKGEGSNSRPEPRLPACILVTPSDPTDSGSRDGTNACGAL
jgi:hypothetical protein